MKTETNIAESEFIQSLQSIKRAAQERDLTLEQVITLFGENSHRSLIGFLCLPFLQPVPFPGLSSIFAMLIIIVSFFLVRGVNPWIPRRWKLQVLKSSLLLNLIEKTETFWEKIEKLIHPRWLAFQKWPWLRYFDFLLILQCALLLALPLPVPLSNLIPVLPIFLNCLGHVEDDGVLIVISYVLYLGTLIFFATLLSHLPDLSVLWGEVQTWLARSF